MRGNRCRFVCHCRGYMSTNGKRYDPANPHPLSQLRTELVWEGKYDEYGNRREIEIAGLSMPMQRIETIDQPRRDAAAVGQLDMFNKRKPGAPMIFATCLSGATISSLMASLLKILKARLILSILIPLLT